MLEECRDAAGEADAALALLGNTLAQASMAPDVATADSQVTTAAAAAEQARLWCLEHDRLVRLAAATTHTAYESDLLTQVRWPQISCGRHGGTVDVRGHRTRGRSRHRGRPARCGDIGAARRHPGTGHLNESAYHQCVLGMAAIADYTR